MIETSYQQDFKGDCVDGPMAPHNGVALIHDLSKEDNLF
jgi:hypothetical protein